MLSEAESLLQQRCLEDAWLAFNAAEAGGAAPAKCAAGRWTTAMLQGRFADAWQQSDAIRQGGHPDPHRFWTGEPLNGKRVIVRCLHGLGDSVQMLRYLPLLRERAQSVTVEMPPHLLPLAPCFDGVDHAITWGADAPAISPLWDAQVEVMELPYLFRTQLEDLPLATTYLVAPQELVRQTAHRMEPGPMPRVGMVWSASEWDPTRCLPRECVERLLATPGATFWNLQGGPQHRLGMQSNAIAALHDAATFGDGLLTLAAVIANLDLVITVDTLAAHLAGAMGTPAWVLLQARADWRWMHGRADSLWYPSLRLWRQTVQDDWPALTAEVCAALAGWAEDHRHG